MSGGHLEQLEISFLIVGGNPKPCVTVSDPTCMNYLCGGFQPWVIYGTMGTSRYTIGNFGFQPWVTYGTKLLDQGCFYG